MTVCGPHRLPISKLHLLSKRQHSKTLSIPCRKVCFQEARLSHGWRSGTQVLPDTEQSEHRFCTEAGMPRHWYANAHGSEVVFSSLVCVKDTIHSGARGGDKRSTQTFQERSVVWNANSRVSKQCTENKLIRNASGWSALTGEAEHR